MGWFISAVFKMTEATFPPYISSFLCLVFAKLYITEAFIKTKLLIVYQESPMVS